MKTKPVLILILFFNIFFIPAQELALVRENNVFGYINKSGAYEINDQFKKAKSFSENGFAPVKPGSGKWDFINEKGALLGNTWYQNVELFVTIKQ